MLKSNKYSAAIIFIVLGAISGYSAGTLVGANDIMGNGSPAIYYLPGLFFGIAIFAGSFLFKKLPILQGLLWTAASTVAYYIAVHAALFLESTDMSFPIAGFVGALLVGGAYSALFGKLHPRRLLMLAILGALLGIPEFYPENLTALIAAWQAGVAGLLGYWMSQEKKSA